MKYAINSNLRKLSKADFLKLCTPKNIPNKNKILEYLKSFDAEYCSAALVYDVVTGKETQTDELGFTDGEYTWYSSWIYHFEKYNLKLNDDFIEHILKAT